MAPEERAIHLIKMNGVDPLDWLSQTLARIAQGWPVSEMEYPSGEGRAAYDFGSSAMMRSIFSGSHCSSARNWRTPPSQVRISARNSFKLSIPRGGRTGAIWALHHLLEPLRAMEKSGCLGSYLAGDRKGLRWRHRHDRQFLCPRSSACGHGEKGIKTMAAWDVPAAA